MMAARAKYSWAVLAYTLFVLISGAYVRATGSGAGCGSHWPLCNGQVIPRAAQMETIIEFSHRTASGLTLALVSFLVIWAWRSSAAGHPIRRTSALALLFLLMEAAIGAWLVQFNLVTENDSVARAAILMLHLINTFFLLAALTLTARWATIGDPVPRTKRGPGKWLVGAACVATVIVGASGAVTALGDTLFPPATLLDGFRQDFSAAAHFLIRLRIWHPFIAAGSGLYLGALLLWIRHRYAQVSVRTLANGLIVMFLLQGFLGLANVALLAPVWMQMLHLSISTLIWIALVLMAAAIAEVPKPEPATAS